MAETRHVQHLRSKVVDGQTGQPKLPLSSSIEYGEIAINYHKGVETISLKNDNNEIVSFGVIDTRGLNDKVSELETKVETISGNVTTISGDVRTISGNVTTISGNVTTISGDVRTISGNVTTISGDVRTISGNVVTLSGQLDSFSGQVIQAIEEDERVTSSALNDLNSRLCAFTESTEININAISGDVEVLKVVSGSVVNKADLSAVTKCFNDVKYESSGGTKVIKFYNDETYLDKYIDATDFIKDRFLDSVEVKDVTGSGTCIVFTWNEVDGRQEVTNIPLSDLIDTSLYYEKSEINTMLAAKSDTSHTHASSAVTSMRGYSKQSSYDAITSGDSLNVAIGKLEKGLEDAIGGGVSSVSLSTGSTPLSMVLSVNGTAQNTVNVPSGVSAVTLEEGTVNGALTLRYSGTTKGSSVNVPVHGLGGAAYMNTGNTSSTVAVGNHKHTSGDVTNFSAAVEAVIISAMTDTSSTVSTTLESIISSNTKVVSAMTTANLAYDLASSALSKANSAYTDASSAITLANSAITIANLSGALAEFYTGCNTVTSISDLPTTKRLIIVNATENQNNLTVSGVTDSGSVQAALPSGYELHIIVNNGSTGAIDVALPSGSESVYKFIGDNVSIPTGSYGELNIISDGEHLYVRGA